MGLVRRILFQHRQGRAIVCSFASEALKITLTVSSCSVYLESLCDKLCDYLRPRILHEPKLDTLCELCTIIQALMSLDPGHPSDADGDEQDGISAMDPLTPPATHSTHNPFFSAPSTSTPTNPTKSFGEAQQQYHQSLGHLQFSRLLQGILQDAQTRLVFRSQAIIQSEVMHYQPSDADLDYPNKLKGTNRQMSLWPASLDEHEEDREGSSLRLPDSDIQDTWYPTLRKTLWVLTRLHTYVKVGRLAVMLWSYY